MKILIVEYEQELIDSIGANIKSGRMELDYSSNLEDAKRKLAESNYDLCLVDIELPDGSGLELIIHIKWRCSDTRIIILSANDSSKIKVEALNLGADDYLAKPFDLSELNARINSILRRKGIVSPREIRFNEIKIVLDNYKVFVREQNVNLTKKEYELLIYFITNKNKVITKQALASNVWKDYLDNVASFDFLYSHIKNLRKKLQLNGCRSYIQNINGVGYRFQEVS
jgi:DNA-binding response OmpR family regulator